MEHVISETEDDEPYGDLRVRTTTQLAAQYRQWIDAHSKTGGDALAARKGKETERSLRLVALRAERDELHRAAQSGASSDELRRFIREIDLQKWRFGSQASKESPK